MGLQDKQRNQETKSLIGVLLSINMRNSLNLSKDLLRMGGFKMTIVFTQDFQDCKRYYKKKSKKWENNLKLYKQKLEQDIELQKLKAKEKSKGVEK